MRDLAIVILAAGQGKRMQSTLPKVLHPLGGRPMIQYVLDAASALGPSRLVMVVGHGANQVRTAIDQDVIFVEQTQRKGTGHAVMQAEAVLDNCHDVLVLYGDMPLLQSGTLQGLLNRYRASNSPIAMLIVSADESRGFGRVILDPAGHAQAVVEEVECTPQQLAIRELNAGVYCFESKWLWNRLRQLPLHTDRGNAGEYFLTDLVEIAAAEGFEIPYLITEDSSQTLGINTLEHLSEAEAILRNRQEDVDQVDDKYALTH
jgi:bifunctional UDP-N-acetylglucosamine pyrophosphorylase/glucosamine-1-phosphate N-acetyltransferase